ncbi:hypothetical protein CRE_22532 [Caenorhabditis remanei]|uniref:DUF38 domain-containing protein n=1 Tax=Caenorhabditis remanei TaxID=31234 RepID=E3MU04_CAERE|nr:hypothetical protein CRE_22532 [Caenorhabditis remanei]
MQSIRHPEPTHIEITISRRRMYVSLMHRFEVCSLWSIIAEYEKRLLEFYRDDIIGGASVRVMKLGDSRFNIDAPQQPENAIKALVNHMKEVFKLPLIVDFRPNGMNDFLRFIPIFPVCKRFLLYGTEPISSQELKYIEDNVVVEERYNCMIPVN